MIKSMTGFSHKKFENDDFSCIAEVKSLNSKFFDAQVRLPRVFSNREMEVRSRASDVLQRGKVSITVDVEFKGDAKAQWQVDREVFIKYYRDLKSLGQELQDDSSDIFSRVLEIPEVSELKDTENLDAHWEKLLPVINEALLECDQFRMKEGQNLEEQVVNSIEKIGSRQLEISGMQEARKQKIREKIHRNLDDFEIAGKLDENRLEQEVIYYLEKSDISEELTRMRSHIDFFLENIGAEHSQGKKLGFISQEIGREINTLGSKANDAQIQRMVVEMKDELEKIKEQLLNIL